MPDYAVEMTGVTKRFPLVTANDSVDFAVEKGCIHALVGENGAGKTTLMNLLYGLLKPTSGTIAVNGQAVAFNSPAEAIALGVGMVHQHFMLIPTLTAAENVVLGREPSRFGFVDIDRANREVGRLSELYGLRIEPRAKVEALSVGLQQRIEILKVLYRGADILILDEPTAVLAPQEVQELFAILRSLKDQGKTIIFITHKLKEVKAVADRITVMRRGRSVGTVETAGLTTEQIAAMMVGRKVLFRVDRGPADPGRAVLTVSDLRAKGAKGLPALKGIDLTVREGEIVGLAGVEGNGQTELVEVLTGLRRVESGSVELSGRAIANASPRTIRAAGQGHIPEDRQRRGLILDYSVALNSVLGVHHRPPYVRRRLIDVINFEAIRRTARRLIERFDIRPTDPDNQAGVLSGGNQQKLVVAREMDQDPKLLIAAQPTRGVDVGSIEAIHRRLVQARDAGKAVLVVSADLDEILSLADRIAVIYEGRIVGLLAPEEADEERLGLMMTGGTTAAVTGKRPSAEAGA